MADYRRVQQEHRVEEMPPPMQQPHRIHPSAPLPLPPTPTMTQQYALTPVQPYGHPLTQPPTQPYIHPSMMQPYIHQLNGNIVPFHCPPGYNTAPEMYCVQLPRDVEIRPAPAHHGLPLQHHLERRRRGRRCCWVLLALFLISGILLGILLGGPYLLVNGPSKPQYSVEKLYVLGFNHTSLKRVNQTSPSSSTTLYPYVHLEMRVRNPNNHVPVYYTNGSSIGVSYSSTELCRGAAPVLYQPAKDWMAFQVDMKGSSLKLRMGDYDTLTDQLKKEEVPLRLDLNVPAQYRIIFFKTWRFTVKVHCYVAVDKFAEDASVVYSNCHADTIVP